MHRMIQSVKQIARHEIAQFMNAALGVVQSVHGQNGESYYACTVKLRESAVVLPKVPIATGLSGVAALPRENDLVVVLFAGGDLHAPVVVGRLYNDQVKPPVHGPGELAVSLPGDEEADDKRLQLNVTTPGDGTRSIKIVLDGNVKVEVEVVDQEIRLQTQDAKLSLTQTGGSDGRAELSVGDSSVVIEQAGNVTVTASGKLTLKGNEVEISGDASIKVAAQTIDLN
jgi:uncharacterized protein involved in type VI secretion and phage assembly